MPELSNNDHTFAEYLRKHDAINHWTANRDVTTWYTPDGDFVARAEFDNHACTYEVYV